MGLPAISNTKLWLALLHEVKQAGGAASPKDVISKMSAYFPEITPAELAMTTKTGEQLLRNRVMWVRQKLVERGCLAKQKGIWVITPDGAKWLHDNWKGSGADYRSVVKPSLLKAAPPTPTPPPPQPKADGGFGELENPTPAPTAVVVVTDPTERLCKLLSTTQRQSGTSQKFERALTEAFAALGFEARHIGGSGETDVFITARYGQTTYTAVIDAKSTHSGKVTDAQIS